MAKKVKGNAKCDLCGNPASFVHPVLDVAVCPHHLSLIRPTIELLMEQRPSDEFNVIDDGYRHVRHFPSFKSSKFVGYERYARKIRRSEFIRFINAKTGEHKEYKGASYIPIEPDQIIGEPLFLTAIADMMDESNPLLIAEIIPVFSATEWEKLTE